MAPPTPTINSNSRNPTRAAKPSRVIFDPWNSSSKGHQHAENRLSGSRKWRDSRTLKLREQFGDAAGRGGKRMADSIVRGRDDDDQVKKNKGECSLWSGHTRNDGEEGPRKRRRRTIESNADLEQESPPNIDDSLPDSLTERSDGTRQCLQEPRESYLTTPRPLAEEEPTLQEKQLFRGLTFYINGSTHPLISDHKLKRLLAAHGGNLSLALGRRTVTHVILGTPSGHDSTSKGAGGGLAGGKIEKEITSTKISPVRFVGVEWVLECLKRGRRVPESDYAPKVAVAGRGQRSALAMLKRTNGADKDNG